MLVGRCITLYQYYRLRYRCYTRGARRPRPLPRQIRSDEVRFQYPFQRYPFPPYISIIPMTIRSLHA